MIKIGLLGQTQVQVAGRVVAGRDFGGVKCRQILEILALQVGRPVSKSRLIDLLWGPTPPESALATLEGYVSLLRGRVEPGVPTRSSVIRTVNGGYLLDADRVTVDLSEVWALVAQGRTARSGAALGLLHRALEAGAADLLGSNSSADWAETARREHAQLMIEVGTEAAQIALDLGQPELAVELARGVLARDELAEHACRIAVQGLWAVGRTAAAVTCYTELRLALSEQLGVGPAPATQDLMTQILREQESPRIHPQRRATDPAGSGSVGSGAHPRMALTESLAASVIVALRHRRPADAQDDDPELSHLLRGLLDYVTGAA